MLPDHETPALPLLKPNEVTALREMHLNCLDYALWPTPEQDAAAKKRLPGRTTALEARDDIFKLLVIVERVTGVRL